MPYVYSTLTADNQYTAYSKGGDGQPLAERAVLIKGGSNVADPNTLLTPYGVPTKVTDDELEFLETIPAFRQHRDAGFLAVSKDKVEAEVVAADMTLRDGSAPLTPEDVGSSEPAQPNERARRGR